MSNFIITFTPYFKKVLLKELMLIDSKIQLEKMFSDGIALVSSSYDTETFINKMLNQSSIFVKHMMPVMSIGHLNYQLEDDKTIILQNLLKFVELSGNDKFSVQCRIIKGGEVGLDYSSKDIEVYVGQHYESLGNIPIFSDNNITNDDIKVISILIYKDEFYLGFSTSVENLNFHCDEYRICSKNGREISRAENKLKEALAKFNIKLSGEGYALDIGAAPGGWTKVLADYGYNVIAVDPGDLKANLLDNPKIKHYKCRIEKLELDNFFDIIVNDMNVDPQATSHIMNSLATTLKKNGLAIVTLKLPQKVEVSITESIDILSNNYEIIAVKSLFHNRQEVTVLIKKKA